MEGEECEADLRVGVQRAGRESAEGIWTRRCVEGGRLKVGENFHAKNGHGENREKVWKQEQESKKHYRLIMVGFIQNGRVTVGKP